ncbi:Pleiotropic drug resistance protein transporter [Phytophthora megakarya]|uniref:Pleiotropic drug resistance protein transporter n=1 Tax=Phytophthora megakarya TaxID=4795 RepID=A0A225WR54_9STRA|nr:Pleiotropic drug resistance protein transporter [Phytophthora megakarya]
MIEGPEVLHDLIASKMETATGRSLPEVNVHFDNLSVTADISVANKNEAKNELPTMFNETKKMFTTSKNHVVRKKILKNVTGAFKPGKITLLLGQPGSGKSSLMKILSGRFPEEKNITVEGDISYNGIYRETLRDRLPQIVSYVNQRDKHYPLLTVKETLKFAKEVGGAEFLREAEEKHSNDHQQGNTDALDAVRAISSHYPDIIVQQFGLQNCQDTIVGDTMTRGVSGGERKRVTTAEMEFEMEFGMKTVALMDEISTGLDSAATFDIINTQRSVARKLRKTVVIALLQPSPEVFALFDDVMVLNEGEVMYHGPCAHVQDYFESLGFSCPPERDLADFLLDLGTSQQYRYQVDSYQRNHPRLASEFANHFRQSLIHQEMLHQLAAPPDPKALEMAEQRLSKVPAFQQSFLESIQTLFRRQVMVLYRNKPFIIGRVVMILIMGLLYSTVFYDFDPTEVSVVMGVLFATILFLSMGQSSQVPTYIAEREIFYKQRGANFFSTKAYVLATSASQIPLILAESLIFGVMVYWICGFDADFLRFIIFEIILFLINLSMGMLFSFLAAISPNANVAAPLGIVSLLVFILFAGFIVTKNNIPDFLIWGHWISPMSWGLRALAINEYRASTFDVCVYKSIDYCTTYGVTMGEYNLKVFSMQTDKIWILIDNREKHSVDPVIDEESYALIETPKNGRTHTTDCAVEVDNREKHSVDPVTVAFQDLWYSVPDPHNPKESLNLLKGITGFALPGSITALMGSSGAGKTTLMDVIAGRKTGGKITGKILLNGYEANDLAIRRSTGYCEQMDVHSDAATFREALTFSSFLRQDSSISDTKKYDSVNECIELLGLEDIADQIIRGSSMEQMKRLTIGVELAAQPSVIFLDEPTSGLDARSAKLIMTGVRKVADSGRTIICTIHQPSSDVFALFDSLLLLKRGGETVFFGDLGDNCHNLINYFEEIPGVSPLPTGYNPATWMLECIGAGVSNGAITTDFVKVFNESSNKQLLDTNMSKEGISVPSPDLPEMVFGKKRAANSVTQMKFVVIRFLQAYWRTPSYNLTRILISLFLGLVFGLVFVDATYTTYSGLNSGAGLVYMAALFNAFVSFESVLPVVFADRAAFYRERASQTYNAFWYFVGSTIVEIPYSFVSGLVFTVVFYPLVGFEGFGTAVIFWLAYSMMTLMQVYQGQMLAFVFPTEEVAIVAGYLVNAIMMMFMGFSPPANAIPSGYKWLYNISPLKYPLSTMVALVFADCDELPTWDESTQTYINVGSQLGCKPMENAPVTVGHTTLKEYTEDHFGMKHDRIARNFGVIVLIMVIYRFLGLLAIRFVNHQKR